LFDKNTSI